MVFQDYELIHTKRVNRQRIGSDIYFHRYFNAFGGWNSVFFVAISAIAGHQLRAGFGNPILFDRFINRFKQESRSLGGCTYSAQLLLGSPPLRRRLRILQNSDVPLILQEGVQELQERTLLRMKPHFLCIFNSFIFNSLIKSLYNNNIVILINTSS